jgi:outer membrane protein assembly factor BamB
MTGVPTIPKRPRFLLGPRALLGVLRLALGALRAIDASTLKELWNSDQKPDGSDRLGNVAKFTPVTVANGKVYVPTYSNKLVVCGLKKP